VVYLSNKKISRDFVELRIDEKDSKLLKHLLKKEQRRERRRLRKVKKKKKKKTNYFGEF